MLLTGFGCGEHASRCNPHAGTIVAKRGRMSIRKSRHSKSHVVFHCPACFADRVGTLRRGPWHAWPDDRPDVGDHITCTGCGSQIHPCNVVDSVTATAFSTRLFSGVRSLMASIVSAGPSGEGLHESAVEAVRTFSSLPYSCDRLKEDLAAPGLPTRLRGDLILLAEQLDAKAAEVLLARASHLASLLGGASEPQRAILEEAATYLRRRPLRRAERSTA